MRPPQKLPRFSVIAHDWNSRVHGPINLELIGIADDPKEADRMVAEHAAAHGKPRDHQNYSVSVVPWPDPECMARDKVAGWIRNGRTYGDVVKSSGGHIACAHSSHVGGFFFAPGAVTPTKLAPYELACRVGHDWQIFDIRVLWAEETSGMRQGSLL